MAISTLNEFVRVAVGNYVFNPFGADSLQVRNFR